MYEWHIDGSIKAFKAIFWCFMHTMGKTFIKQLSDKWQTYAQNQIHVVFTIKRLWKLGTGMNQHLPTLNGRWRHFLIYNARISRSLVILINPFEVAITLQHFYYFIFIKHVTIETMLTNVTLLTLVEFYFHQFGSHMFEFQMRKLEIKLFIIHSVYNKGSWTTYFWDSLRNANEL